MRVGSGSVARSLPWPTAPTEPQWVDSGGNDAAFNVLARGAFAIDPLGVANGLPNTLGALPRITLGVSTPPPDDNMATPYNRQQARTVCLWKDDLSFTVSENARTRRNFYDGSNQVTTDPAQAVDPMYDGHYSWLVTVSPAATEANVNRYERRRYNVSVAVCYRRDFDSSAEQSAAASFVGGVGLGGGTITLGSGVDTKDGEWLLLCNARVGNNPAVAKWYRVVSAGESPATRITLQGPDWDVARYPSPTAVVIPTVLGVYSTVVEIDSDPLWSY